MCLKPIPVFLPGESHGLRNLAGCSPCGHTELDTTEAIECMHTHTCVNQFEGKYEKLFIAVSSREGLGAGGEGDDRG